MKTFLKGLFLMPAAFAAAAYGGLQAYIAKEEKKRGVHPGNAEKYNADNLEKHPDSLLRGKKVIFLGSSVTMVLLPGHSPLWNCSQSWMA